MCFGPFEKLKYYSDTPPPSPWKNFLVPRMQQAYGDKYNHLYIQNDMGITDHLSMTVK